MNRSLGKLSVVFLLLLVPVAAIAQNYEAEEAIINEKRTVITDQASFSGKKGIALKKEISEPVGSPDLFEPDLTFEIDIREAGTYQLRTNAGINPDNANDLLRKTKNKYESFFARFQVNDLPVSSRIVFSPWRNPNGAQETFGLFDLPKGKTKVKIQLPPTVRLDYIQMRKWRPPALPNPMADWQPSVVPPKGHPRLWVRPEQLPKLKKNLLSGENKPVWDLVQKSARRPYNEKVSLDIIDKNSISALYRYLKAITQMAFYYLVDGDKKIGREAVEKTVFMIKNIQFGNIMDITRERGLVIYTAALVYDWCYPLLSEEDKKILAEKMLLNAREMEISWPPFRQIIVNGHGNESQLLRDLLAMSIAVYESDPEPYRICAYRILEELVPMRAFEYQSPRHNQGISYASFRFTWELTAALLLERMSGRRVFNENICGVADYFLQMRLPDGQMFNDADQWGTGQFRYPQAALMMYAYGKNPVMKAEYFRQRGGKPESSFPILFLLLNDPELKPDFSFDTVPAGYDFGPVFSGQVLRTGWMKKDWFKDGRTFEPDSNEAIVEIRGGNFGSDNHQHEDAGAFQIWYRGKQTCDLGIYGFYGTPYDVNFNKRSSSHNLVFIVDPNEKFPGTLVNDGGQRVINKTPLIPKDYLENPFFHTSKIIRSKIEPSSMKPLRSEFTLDLTPAYSDKAQSYIRSFRWINLQRKDVPTALIVYDKVTVRELLYQHGSAKKDKNDDHKSKGQKENNNSKNDYLKSFWQICTLNKPKFDSDGFISSAPLPEQASIKPGRMSVTVLLPKKEDRTTVLFGEEKANDIFENHFQAPPKNLPETQGWRVQYSNKSAKKTTVYLNVIQLLADDAKKLPVKFSENNGKYIVEIDGHKEVFNE